MPNNISTHTHTRARARARACTHAHICYDKILLCA